MKAKNIGLLATLALVTTVGGVYAAFTYNSTAEVIGTVTGDTSISIDVATTSNPKGTLVGTLTGASLFFDNQGSNTARLNVAGSLEVVFTSGAPGTVDQTIIDNGIDVDVVFTVTNDLLNEKHIFSLYGTAGTGSTTLAATDATKDTLASGQKTYTWTIELEDVVTVTTDTDLKLETKAEYDKFALAIKNAALSISIEEHTA